MERECRRSCCPFSEPWQRVFYPWGFCCYRHSSGQGAPESASSSALSAAEVILASVRSVSYGAHGAIPGSSTANTPEMVSCLCEAERLKTGGLRSSKSSEQCGLLEVLFSQGLVM